MPCNASRPTINAMQRQLPHNAVLRQLPHNAMQLVYFFDPINSGMQQPRKRRNR